MFQNTKTGIAINLQAEDAVAITASDATTSVYVPAGQLYVGGAGTVVCITVAADSSTNASAVTFKGVAAGTILPVLVQRVLSTGTTATGLVILK